MAMTVIVYYFAREGYEGVVATFSNRGMGMRGCRASYHPQGCVSVLQRECRRKKPDLHPHVQSIQSPLLNLATSIRGSGTEGDLLGTGAGRMQLLIVVVAVLRWCRSLEPGANPCGLSRPRRLF